MVLSLVIFFVLVSIRSLEGSSYELLLDDPNVFGDCRKDSKNILGLSALIDLSEFVSVMDKDIVTVSGNTTLNSEWEILPTDRIEVHINAFHWEVGVWQPTVFNLVYKDFCKVMYDPKQYFYTYWTQYITNGDEVKDKCINVPGTKFLYRTYELRFNLNANGPSLSGRYKAEFTLEAFDELNIKRPTSICFMASGEFIKKGQKSN